MPHWKRPFKSDHLSSSDIVEKELVLTIEYVKQEMCKSQSGDELANVAYFTDKKWKPMRLNVTNSTIVRRFSGNNSDTDNWKNIPIAIYVNPNVRLGKDTVEGLRIRAVQPKLTPKGEVKKQEITPKSPNWDAIVQWCKDGNHPDQVWSKYDISEENKVIFMAKIKEAKK